MPFTIKGRHLTSILDLSKNEIDKIFESSTNLKMEQKKMIPHRLLQDKVLAMIFEKPSTRTRVSFQTGIFQLGGTGLYLSSQDLQLGRGETISDTARVISRYVDCIMARVFSHKTITALAEFASVPVINGLSDYEHPCQALADLFTMRERFDDLKGRKLAYIGDGNNVCNSLMYICAKLGVNFAGAFPNTYFPKEDVIENTKELLHETGAQVQLGTDPIAAVSDADAVYTDVWVSMGEENVRDQKINSFKEYQVNSTLLNHAKEDAIVLHCLPAHRNEEITDEVIDGPQSAVWDQAENRLHVQKAIMALLMVPSQLNL